MGDGIVGSSHHSVFFSSIGDNYRIKTTSQICIPFHMSYVSTMLAMILYFHRHHPSISRYHCYQSEMYPV